jgi:phosphoribosylamine-glycine ligase
LWDLLVAAADGDLAKIAVQIDHGSAMTVVIAAPGYPAHPIFGQRIDLGKELADTAIFHAGTKSGKHGVEVSGGRVLAVTGWGKDLKSARERAYAGVKNIRFEGQHFRRDIGHRALGKVVS